MDAVNTQAIAETSEKRLALLISIDRSFVIEQALCKALLGQPGDDLMESHILKLFPSENEPKKLDATYEELKVLKEGKVAKSTGPSAGQMLASAMEVVDGMLRGSAPQQKFMTSGIMQKIAPTLQYFCQASSGRAGSPALVGEPAAVQMLKDIKKKRSDSTLVFSDLEPLHAFQWLLDEAKQEELSGITKSLVSAVTTAPVKQKAARGSKAAAGKKGKNAAQSSTDGPTDMAIADVMSLFS